MLTVTDVYHTHHKKYQSGYKSTDSAFINFVPEDHESINVLAASAVHFVKGTSTWLTTSWSQEGTPTLKWIAFSFVTTAEGLWRENLLSRSFMHGAGFILKADVSFS